MSLLTSIASLHAEPLRPSMNWSRLPAIPDPEGFAGAYTGVSGGALIVAGGANISGDKWKEPFVKKWYDSAFVLEQPDSTWKSGFKLPHALGYGVSITADDSVICIGGSNELGHFADVFRLRWSGGELRTESLPSLPKPCANACGALVDRIIYVAGGIETPTATHALHTFWSLDLDDLASGWKVLPPWPGPERMLAVCGALHGSFYLFTGTKLSSSPDGKPVREYLHDAWRFTPGKGWTQIASLPRTAVAAASPALPFGDSRLLVISGDDGKNVTFQPVEHHPGFPRTALAYDASTDAWSELDGVPFSRATVPATIWLNRIVIPNGEARPRVRTPEVWSLSIP